MKTLITATAMLTVVTLLVALCVNVKMDFPVMVSHAQVSFSVGGGHIFIYSCSAQLISFEIDCFHGL